MLKKLQTIKKNLDDLTRREIDRIVIEVLEDNEELIVELNRGQLLKGKDNKDKTIGTYRNPSYAKYKKKLNPAAGGKVDLKLTGRFHDNIYLRTDPKLRIWSRDQKVDALVRKYGASIFGLAPQSVKALERVVIPQILKKLKARIGLR